MLCVHIFTAKMPLWSIALLKATSSLPTTISQGACSQCHSSGNNLTTEQLICLVTYLICISSVLFVSACVVVHLIKISVFLLLSQLSPAVLSEMEIRSYSSSSCEGR